jgi:anaerobic ribonucleoside-triphosphate reductase
MPDTPRSVKLRTCEECGKKSVAVFPRLMSYGAFLCGDCADKQFSEERRKLMESGQ